MSTPLLYHHQPSRMCFWCIKRRVFGTFHRQQWNSPASSKSAGYRRFPTTNISSPASHIPGPHWFLPSLHTRMCQKLIVEPLNTLLSGGNEHLSWDDTTTQSFSAVKEALASATLLAHPKPHALTNIMTDTSNTAVLQQYINRQWQPISFFSKKLQPAETRYSTFYRELLAIYLAILEGCTFHVVTDHKPLTFAFQARPDHHQRR